MFRSLRWGFAALPLMLIAVVVFSADDKKKPEAVTVKKVLEVKLAMTKKLPPDLLITAFGEVNSGGWTNPTLTAVTYIKQPDDGIQDFTFTATPPDGPSIQVISKIEAKATLKDLPKWVKGVRIHGDKDGTIEKKL